MSTVCLWIYVYIHERLSEYPKKGVAKLPDSLLLRAGVQPQLGTNPLNSLKTGTNTLADLFRRNKSAGRNKSAVTPELDKVLDRDGT